MGAIDTMACTYDQRFGGKWSLGGARRAEEINSCIYVTISREGRLALLLGLLGKGQQHLLLLKK